MRFFFLGAQNTLHFQADLLHSSVCAEGLLGCVFSSASRVHPTGWWFWLVGHRCLGPCLNTSSPLLPGLWLLSPTLSSSCRCESSVQGFPPVVFIRVCLLPTNHCGGSAISFQTVPALTPAACFSSVLTPESKLQKCATRWGFQSIDHSHLMPSLPLLTESRSHDPS